MSVTDEQLEALRKDLAAFGEECNMCCGDDQPSPWHLLDQMEEMIRALLKDRERMERLETWHPLSVCDPDQPGWWHRAPTWRECIDLMDEDDLS